LPSAFSRWGSVSGRFFSPRAFLTCLTHSIHTRIYQKCSHFHRGSTACCGGSHEPGGQTSRSVIIWKGEYSLKHHPLWCEPFMLSVYLCLQTGGLGLNSGLAFPRCGT
jgi:hypothetical protein